MKEQVLNIIYYIPNLEIPKQEKIVLNKYGRMRLKYLKEHKKADYTIMLMNGILNTHLKEIQETADNRVQQIISELKSKSDLTEDMKNTDMLYLVGTMNSIKAQAEETVFRELIYVQKLLKENKYKIFIRYKNKLCYYSITQLAKS